jgi:hypothetical protein
MKKKGSIASSLVLLGLLTALALTWFNRNTIYDSFRLRNYQPNSKISQLADDATMTSYSKHMFYINHPVVEDKTGFNQDCPNDGGEQTIILGCYHGNQHGIYLYSVSDPKLNGVEQVTAAHETLHAIYDRLSPKDKAYVDNLLLNYYHNTLKDRRLLDTIASYQKTEPNDVVNEMHSVFGTEVVSLPPALEAYYAKYFSNRQKIAGYAQKYQQTFTNNQGLADKYFAQIKSIEQQLSSLKGQIDTQESSLATQGHQLNAQSRQSNDPQAYQTAVNQYNAQVESYRALISKYNGLIDQHNNLVAKYLAINTETNQLIKELDSRSSSLATQ